MLYAVAEGSAWVALEVLAYVDPGLAFSPIQTSLSDEQRELVLRHVAKLPTKGRAPHPVLGWVTAKSRTWHGGKSTSNAQGLRGDRTYTTELPEDAVRISAYGDSFTFGDEVANHETWLEQMVELDGRFEALNFGVAAYGLDQAYLRYSTDEPQFESDIVVIGLMSENIFRHLNVFRPFYKPVYTTVLTKPRFALRAGELVLLDNPLPTLEALQRLLQNEGEVLRELGTHDHFFSTGYTAGVLDVSPIVRLTKITAGAVRDRWQPVLTRDGMYDPESEAFTVTTKILAEFYSAALDRESLPIILLYPARRDFVRHLQEQPRRYDPLLAYLRSSGLRHIDLMEAFAARFDEVDAREFLRPRGHYSRMGNAVVAETMLEYLAGNEWEERTAVRSAVRQEQRTVR